MLRFQPIYRTAPWGGRRFATLFERPGVPDGPVGESWELAAFGDHESALVGDPSRTLNGLWSSGALGGSATGPFPFLLKWLDTSSYLSIQVHPDETMCAATGEGRPKTEAWRIASCGPKSEILLGHRSGLDERVLREAIAREELAGWLHAIRPRPGDTFLVQAGTLHALGADLLLLEVQQPSDSTYRVFDWGRVGLDGKPRELHLDAAVRATDFSRTDSPRADEGDAVIGPGFSMRTLDPGTDVPADPLRVVVAWSGHVRFETEHRGAVELRRGDVAVAEPSDGTVRLASGQAVWLSEPPLDTSRANS